MCIRDRLYITQVSQPLYSLNLTSSDLWLSSKLKIVAESTFQTVDKIERTNKVADGDSEGQLSRLFKEVEEMLQ